MDARELKDLKFDVECHIHNSEDSFLEGSSYEIPPTDDGTFWIDDEPHDHSWESHSECAEILISSAVSTTDVQSLLSELITLGKVRFVAKGGERPLDCATVVLLDPDSGLGEHPHLPLARHLSERLSARTLTVPFGLHSESQGDLGNSDWLVVHMDGAWHLAEVVETSTGRTEVRVGSRLSDVTALTPPVAPLMGH